MIAPRLAMLVAAVVACGPADTIAPGPAWPLPPHQDTVVDTTPKARPRMLPPEVYLRAYLTWFGGLTPLRAKETARRGQLFDDWDDYLAALGLPDYKLDLPRQTQSNSLMRAAFGRLGEALCLRTAEHDLIIKAGKQTPPDQRTLFAFDAVARPDAAQFAERFDVLHRTFLGYPAALAPAERAARYYTLFLQILDGHATSRARAALPADVLAWAGVCTALIQHPEAGLY